MEVCSKTTCLGAAAGDCFCRLQFGAAKGDADLQHELFPLHSPLLRESWLVSFPPLSNMLKSSGSSYLIGGPKGMAVHTYAKAVSFDAARAPTCRCDCLLVTKAPTQRRPTTVVSVLRATARACCLKSRRAPTSPQSAAPRPRRELSAAGTCDPTQRRRGG